MNLSEFLLARISEDEASALEAMGYESRASITPAQSAKHYDRWGPDRVHAECEAKRRIVERWQETAPTVAAWGGSPGWADAYTQTINETLTEDVLPYLALPYADHPDYDEAWRP